MRNATLTALAIAGCGSLSRVLHPSWSVKTEILKAELNAVVGEKQAQTDIALAKKRAEESGWTFFEQLNHIYHERCEGV